jgi:DNA-binding LytR/AlgR family response regulator
LIRRTFIIAISPCLGIKNYFFIKIKSRLERIETDDLVVLEADGSDSKLYLKDRIITVSNNLKVMHEKIKNSDFVRIHRKYIINISKIKYLDDNQITLENEMLLPLSDSNKSILLAKLNIV